jgi:hypothetical protein
MGIESHDRLADENSKKLDKLSFVEFIKYVFSRKSSDVSQFSYSFGSTRITVNHLIRLFRKPEFLLKDYSAKQIENGFYFVTQMLCFIKFDGLMWDKRLPISFRQELISSMFDLFQNLFSKIKTETICFMWWDILAFGYYMENGKAEDEDGEEIQQIMFETLLKILEIDSVDCQKSALHGLGHLKHKDTEFVINNFLKNHKVSDELENYAKSRIESYIQ